MAPASPDLAIKTRERGWRLALLVAASALGGGLAVALWNRRALTGMRERGVDGEAARYEGPWEDDQ